MLSEKYHKILMLLVTLSIIGGLASIIIWYTQPDMRMTLVVDYNEAIIAAAVIAVLNILALVSLKMKMQIGPLVVIAITIPNRILGYFHFELAAGQVVFIAWSAILIIFALLDFMQSHKE